MPPLDDPSGKLQQQSNLSDIMMDKKAYFRTNSENLPMSPVEYLSMHPPSLGILRYAFFGLQDRSWFREDIRSLKGIAEVTSTLLLDGKELVEFPQELRFYPKERIWHLRGGRWTYVEVPPDGWILEYDLDTGLPIRTSSNKFDARERFGEDASYFLAIRKGLRHVFRYYDPERGPFCVYAHASPGIRDLHLVARTYSQTSPFERYSESFRIIAEQEISEASLLEADDDWHDFFGAADKDDLAWLRHVVELLKRKPQH